MILLCVTLIQSITYDGSELSDEELKEEGNKGSGDQPKEVGYFDKVNFLVCELRLSIYLLEYESWHTKWEPIFARFFSVERGNGDPETD